MNERLFVDGHIRTYSGTYVSLINPEPEDIHLTDIAHGLSNTCRFGGHTKEFFSVAEHCIKVADMLPQELKLAGLLHDASEAYVGDIPTPLKALIPAFKDIEMKFHHAIAERFDVPVDLFWSKEIKHADRTQLIMEWQCAVVKNGCNPMTHEEARYEYEKLVSKLLGLNVF